MSINVFDLFDHHQLMMIKKIENVKKKLFIHQHCLFSNREGLGTSL